MPCTRYLKHEHKVSNEQDRINVSKIYTELCDFWAGVILTIVTSLFMGHVWE